MGDSLIDEYDYWRPRRMRTWRLMKLIQLIAPLELNCPILDAESKEKLLLRRFDLRNERLRAPNAARG